MHCLAAFLTALTLVAQTSAHVTLISIYGSNGAVGHAFGVNLYGKYPREKGVPGDAGGDSGVFQTGTDNPSPPCGRTPELGPIDIPAWLDQAEGLGLPAAYANLSIVADAFQVNRDGGGPMSCEYNEDATAATWKPMFMTLNQAGNSGIQNQVRNNETVVMNFPEGAKCTGGWTQTACIVRCRTGVNKRFGGCFAAKLDDSASATVAAVATLPLDAALETPLVSNLVNTTLELTEEQTSYIVEQVIIQMKKDGLVVSASTSQIGGASALPNLNVTSLSQISQGIQTQSNSSLSTATFVPANRSWGDSPSTTSNSSADASDAADNHLYNITDTSGSAVAAAAIVDNQVYNISSLAVAPTSKPHKSPKQPRRCRASKSEHQK